MDTFDWSTLPMGATTPDLWSLKTGLTPQPLHASGPPRFEANPFEQSYAVKRPHPVGDDIGGDSKRRNTGQSSGASSGSGATPSNGETPPTEPHSPQTKPLRPMDAASYGHALAQYIQAHEVSTGKASGSTVIATGGGVIARSHSSGSSQRSTSQPVKPSLPLPLPPASLVSSIASTASATSLPPPAIAPQPRKKAKARTSPTKAKSGKKAAAAMPVPAESGHEGFDGDNDAERRRDFLERNRLAATRSRQKRKAWLNGLEGEADRLTTANSDLQVLISQLRSEVGTLRSIVVGHAANGCAGARLALKAARPADLPADALAVTAPSFIAMPRSASIGPSGDIVVGGYAAPLGLPSPQRRARASSAPATSTPSGEKMAQATSYFDLPHGDIDFASFLA